jgi:hypothetical protein
MTDRTVGCLRCGIWYDPARPHSCGVIGDDTAKRLEEMIFETRSRLDSIERRLLGLDAAARCPAQARERTVEETPLPAAPAPAALTLADLRNSEPIKQPFDRKRYQAAYMRRWRARRKGLLEGDGIG